MSCRRKFGIGNFYVRPMFFRFHFGIKHDAFIRTISIISIERTNIADMTMRQLVDTDSWFRRRRTADKIIFNNA